MTERLVIDASVAAKWFLQRDESGVEIAAKLRRASITGDVELHAPAVFTYEVSQLLLSASRRRPARLEEHRVVAGIRSLFAMPIHIRPASEEESVGALRMAIRFSKSFYDMTYVHLAETLDCRWCTADERAARSTDAGFPSDRIVLLSELQVW